MSARVLVVFTTLSTLLLLAAMYAVFRFAPPLVAAQDDTVGEMLLDEGLRFEANGYMEGAIEKYRLAEVSRFEGLKNVRHLQAKLAGVESDPEQRMAYYRDAVQDTQLCLKDPSAWRKAWDGLCEDLADAMLNRELRDTLDAWDKVVSNSKPRELYASSHDVILDAAARTYYRGVLALRAGDRATARQLFREACVDTAAKPRRALADLLEQDKAAPAEVIQRLRDEAAVFSGES